MHRAIVLTLAATMLALLAPGPAAAARSVQYGIQDDAWIASGSGTLEERLATLDSLGVSIVRYTLRWDVIARRRPASERAFGDPAYRWTIADRVLQGLRRHRIAAVVTVYGTPGWANGGHGPNWAPTSPDSLAAFTYAAARRYWWIQRWTIWNEPNQRLWLQPPSPSLYTRVLLNPAYAAIHSANRRALVGGGVTAPRGNTGGVAPVDWIRGMRLAGARLDAYAHNPYPLVPRAETPSRGGCMSCRTITMASLERLLGEVGRNFGAKRVWLTEYGYQTNPPDTWLGVSPNLQARYLGEGALRAYQAPRVDMLIHFLVRDEPILARWQSGLIGVDGSVKPSFRAFALPLAQVSRRGTTAVVWGQVRPRFGAQPYRLQLRARGGWTWAGAAARTNGAGVFQRVIRAGPGARVRIWSVRDRFFSPALTIG